MQPYQPPLSHFYTDSPAFKSRVYVQLFSWFGLFIAFLSLIQGRSFALIHLPLFLLGIYASWDEVISRKSQLVVFAVGCLVWTIFDIAYLLALIVSTNETLRKTAVGIVSSNTFRNLAPALDKVLSALGSDAHFFVIFSAITGSFFDAMAAFWAFALHRDIVEIVAATSPSSASPMGAAGPGGLPGFAGGAAGGAHPTGFGMHHPSGTPITRQPTVPGRAATIGGFGTFSRPTQSTQTSPRSLNPFSGRGFRLGQGESQ